TTTTPPSASALPDDGDLREPPTASECTSCRITVGSAWVSSRCGVVNHWPGVSSDFFRYDPVSYALNVDDGSEGSSFFAACHPGSRHRRHATVTAAEVDSMTSTGFTESMGWRHPYNYHDLTVLLAIRSDLMANFHFLSLLFVPSIKDAERAFIEIIDKDVVAYTAMVTGYAEFTDFNARGAFEIVTFMHREGLNANRVTLVSLLQAAGHLREFGKGRSVHCYALRRLIGVSDEVLLTSLVDMYAKCGAISIAASVLRQTKKRTVASWNALIARLSQLGQSSEALKYFCLMKQGNNLFPDSVTLANVLSACSNRNLVQHTTSLHAYIMRRNIQLDEVLTTTLIELYSKCYKMKRARILFDHLICRDTIVYNVMISGYLHNGLVEEAINIFSDMIREAARPNFATVVSLLSAFADVGDARIGRWVHGIVFRYGLELDLDVSNLIMHMYAKCGQIKNVKMIFDLITDKDLVSWTVMMMGYVNIGLADEATAMFQKMQRTGEEPDSSVIVTLLQAHAQLGSSEPVKEIHGYIYRTCLVEDIATMNSLIITYAKCGRIDVAEAVFNGMTGRELASWNTMIAAYGIHGYCTQVLEMFSQMQRENLKPDVLTFSSVLSACSHAGLVEEGWHIFSSMNSDYLVAPQEEHYNCMVDLLGRAGQLEEAYNLVKCSPLRDRASAMRTLLAACKVHKNTKLGELIGQELLDLEPQVSGSYKIQK
ncbi:PPR repeat, partial [Musa troglodytarum]